MLVFCLVDKSKNYYVFKHNERYFLNNQNVNIGSWKKDEIHYLTVDGKVVVIKKVYEKEYFKDDRIAVSKSY